MKDEEKLNELRGKLNSLLLTREQLADNIGVPYITFTKFLKGSVGMGKENLKKCERYLNA